MGAVVNVCLVCFDADGPGTCARCGVDRLPVSNPEVRDEIYRKARVRTTDRLFRWELAGVFFGIGIGLLLSVALLGVFSTARRDLPLFGSHRMIALIVALFAFGGMRLARYYAKVDVVGLSIEDAIRLAR